jgi:Glycosyltransferase family 87
VSRAAAVKAVVLYVMMPLAVITELYSGWLGTPLVGEDFEGGVWRAGKDVLGGHSPYPHLPLGHIPSGHVPFVYPPSVLSLGVPFSFLPLPAAEAVWALLLFAASAAAFWLLNVRDWRCYALGVISVPVVEGVIVGNLTLLLMPLVALAWRWRDRPVAVAVVVGCLVALKPFFWPLGFWLFITGRSRAALTAAAMAGAALVVSWAAIGFDGLLEYPRLVNAVAHKTSTESYSIMSLATGLGISRGTGQLLEYAVGLVLLGGAAVLARRDDGDRRSLSVVLIATLCLTPLVHRHYFVLLFSMIALRDREITVPWLIPVAFLFRPLLPTHPPVLNGVPYQRDPLDIISVLALAALTLLLLLQVECDAASPERSPVPALEPRVIGTTRAWRITARLRARV